MQYKYRNRKVSAMISGIRKTCPCKEYPLKPHFYIVKLGYAGVYYITYFLFLVEKIDCGYSLAEAVLKCTHNLCFEQIFKKNIIFSWSFLFLFTYRKKISILHGQVFVM